MIPFATLTIPGIPGVLLQYGRQALLWLRLCRLNAAAVLHLPVVPVPDIAAGDIKIRLLDIYINVNSMNLIH